MPLIVNLLHGALHSESSSWCFTQFSLLNHPIFLLYVCMYKLLFYKGQTHTAYRLVFNEAHTRLLSLSLNGNPYLHFNFPSRALKTSLWTLSMQLKFLYKLSACNDKWIFRISSWHLCSHCTLNISGIVCPYNHVYVNSASVLIFYPVPEISSEDIVTSVDIWGLVVLYPSPLLAALGHIFLVLSDSFKSVF